MARTILQTVSGIPLMIHLPSWRSSDATGLHTLLVGHGHGGHEYQIGQGAAMPFAGHPEYLADKGYAVGCAYTGDTWLNSTAMSAITVLRNYLVSLGSSNKASLFGWSMGAGMMLRWALENPTLVDAAYLMAPMTDMDAQYPTFGSEMDSAYSGNYSVNGASRSPLANASSYRNLIPIRLAHATDDPTVPSSNTDDFVAAVNDPAVTRRTPSFTGGHQGPLLQVSPREVWEFLRTNRIP